QGSENDNNANLSYPTLDKSIRTSYASRSTAKSSRTTYDSYVRAIKWASNRVLRSSQGGVVAYVTNNGYLDARSADGIRTSLSDEYRHLLVYGLLDNSACGGAVSRPQVGNLVDVRVGVALILLVRLPTSSSSCQLH